MVCIGNTSAPAVVYSGSAPRVVPNFTVNTAGVAFEIDCTSNTRALLQLAINAWLLAHRPETLAVVPLLQVPPAMFSSESVVWLVPGTAAAKRTGRPVAVRISTTSLPGVRPAASPIVAGAIVLAAPALVATLVAQFAAVVMLAGEFEVSV